MYLAKSWSGQVKDEKFKVLKSVTTVEFKENGDISNYGFHGHVCVLSTWSGSPSLSKSGICDSRNPMF